MLSTALLLMLVLIATVTDLTWRKIYNWTNYTGILAALGLNAMGSLALAEIDITPRQLDVLGWIPVAESIGGGLLCGFIMLACFVTFRVGGGDVKMMAMLGAFLGPEQGITALLWTFVLGACMGLIVLVWRVGILQLMLRLLRQLVWVLRLGGWSPLTEAERAQLQPPLFLAPCALAAVSIVRLSALEYFMGTY